MRRDLLITAGPGEWRAALVEDGAAVELYVERGDTRPPGSVHLGRVVRRAPGLDSAFVEVGDDRPGLLPAREAAADGIRLDEGGRVVVEVRREAQQGKGARLSTRLRPRTGLDLDSLRRDAAALDPPAQLHPPPGFAAALALRLPTAPDHLLADDHAVIPELRAAFPNAEFAFATAEDWPGELDAAIETALAPSLTLTGEGAVHIEETRGATIIDVDTGNPSEGSAELGAVAANLQAAELIARQIRLRNLGGGIIVDFVGLEGPAARDRIRRSLVAALRSDPLEPRVLGWTRLGHLEIVRPRRGRSLSDVLLEPAAGGLRQKRPVTIAHEALRALLREARARPGADWRLAAGSAVAAALADIAGGALRVLEERLGRQIEIVEARDMPDFDIAPR